MVAPSPYSLTHTTLVTPTEILPNADLTVAGGRFQQADRSVSSSTDLSGHLVFPALINAHDHLGGTWWPRVGPSRPYPSVYPWLDELHTSAVRAERQLNTVADVYELGMYRCLFSGVATVADHMWRIDGPGFYERLPIEVMYKYGRTWTVREPTAWGEDIETEYSLAVRTGQPYIIHLAEGLDAETTQEMDTLLAAGALGRNTLIVHGVGLRPLDMQAMAAVGSSLCWCPGSNLYLYEQTADLPALTHAGINITLGTDSSLSGELNLLEELRTAHRYLVNRGGQLALGGRSIEQWLVEAVTTRAAQALLRQERCGRIAPGYRADLLVLPDRGLDPYTTLIEAQVSDIALLCRAGVPVYGDTGFEPLFDRYTPHYSRACVHKSAPSAAEHSKAPPATLQTKLVAGDPVALIGRMSQAVGHPLDLPFLPLSIHEEQIPCPAS
jgi:cytosine/adenosine deaminase-related metal-dependent hydrolase